MGNQNFTHGPITTKNIKDSKNNLIRYGIAEMQGWRRTMEDSVMAIDFFDKNKTNFLFGIMDGHGGSIISKYVAYNFKDFLINLDSFKEQNYENALIETYLKLDECLKHKEVNELLYSMSYDTPIEEDLVTEKELKKKHSLSKQNKKLTKVKFKNKSVLIDLFKKDKTYYNPSNYERNNNFIANQMGTTANILMIINNSLYLANCGDSLSVMFKNGEAIKLNREHKTTLESEKERILKSGNEIINNRIAGKLNLTRAIGDLEFKKNYNLKYYEQSVISYPEITFIDNIYDIDFIIMACDGLWDCVDPQKLCENIYKKLLNFKKNNITDFNLSDIISHIFDTILSKTNNTPIGTDNMSCIIILFENGNNNLNKLIEINNNNDLNEENNNENIKNS